MSKGFIKNLSFMSFSTQKKEKWNLGMLKVVRNVQNWPQQGLGSNPVTTEPHRCWDAPSYKNNQPINKPQQKAHLLEDLKVNEKNNYLHKCTALWNLRRTVENMHNFYYYKIFMLTCILPRCVSYFTRVNS